jgi:glycosyltransferase involved in cell wall biosynthesis
VTRGATTVDVDPSVASSPRAERPLRIAMIGLRGLPARYSGIEAVVEALGAALVERGHDVTVYCRAEPGERPVAHLGIQLRHVRTVRTGGWATMIHSLFSTVHALGCGYDVVHYHAVGPALSSPLARLGSRARVVVTVHGRDDQRAKWGRATRRVLRVGVWISARIPHATVVVSRDLVRDFDESYRRVAHHVTNAVTVPDRQPPGPVLAAFDLEPGRYVLTVGRLVPEKGIHVLVDAYQRVDTAFPLVIVGEPSGTEAYVAELRRSTDAGKIRFVGAQHGPALAELETSARLFVTASALEGLPTALIEAALYELPVVVTDIPPHREILDGGPCDAHICPVDDPAAFAAAITAALADSGASRAVARSCLRERLLERHDPMQAAAAHEALYRDLLERDGGLTPARAGLHVGR